MVILITIIDILLDKTVDRVKDLIMRNRWQNIDGVTNVKISSG